MAITANTAPYIAALQHASNHRGELDRSARCACFFCFLNFETAEIRRWIDKNQTALCPRCGIDAVIGNASGHSIDDRFLRKLHQHHFGARAR